MEVGDRIILTSPSWMDAPHTRTGTIYGPFEAGWWRVDVDGLGRVLCHEAALQVVS